MPTSYSPVSKDGVLVSLQQASEVGEAELLQSFNSMIVYSDANIADCSDEIVQNRNTFFWHSYTAS